MSEIIRNLARRKLRTGLTIFGITIGIFALSVMGSLSEYLNTTIDAGIRYSGDLIRVLPKTGIGGLGVMKESLGDELKTLPHVKAVTGELAFPLEEQAGGAANPLSAKFGAGIDPAVAADALGQIGLESGRMLQAGDGKVALLGHSLAANAGLSVGGTKEIKDVTFTVVGILKPTQVSELDNSAVVPLHEAQDFLGSGSVVNLFVVVPDDSANSQGIADQINKDFPKTFNALSPGDIKKQAQQGTLIFNIIILAGAALAAVVGGLSTINTMIMSVAERTREIGIKKAVGASNPQIIREFLTESAVIGLLGGAVGVTLAKIATLAINAYTKANASGLQVFDLTPRLILLALGFAVVLGALAGLIPAISAARMNIVKALSEE